MIFRPWSLIFLFAGSVVQAQTSFFGVVLQVADGDTLWVQSDGRGRTHKLRIEGIDAPEICQPGGEAARNRLAQQVMNKHVEVTVKRRDIYGRRLAVLRLGGNDVGAQMVLSGHAWSYRWHRSVGPYAAEEAVARQSRLGLFSDGEPEEPRAFRRQHGSCHTGD